MSEPRGKRKAARKAVRKPRRLEPKKTQPEPAPVTLDDPQRFWEVAHMVGGYWLGGLEEACNTPLMIRAVLYAMDRAVSKLHPDTDLTLRRGKRLLDQLKDAGIELGIEVREEI